MHPRIRYSDDRLETETRPRNGHVSSFNDFPSSGHRISGVCDGSTVPLFFGGHVSETFSGRA
jgi:hypothetical protein